MSAANLGSREISTVKERDRTFGLSVSISVSRKADLPLIDLLFTEPPIGTDSECGNLAILQQPIECSLMDPEVISQFGYGHHAGGIMAAVFCFMWHEESNPCATMHLILVIRRMIRLTGTHRVSLTNH